MDGELQERTYDGNGSGDGKWMVADNLQGDWFAFGDGGTIADRSAWRNGYGDKSMIGSNGTIYWSKKLQRVSIAHLQYDALMGMSHVYAI